jgi:hypothetical protein
MAMIVRGEERTCNFCFVNKKVKVDAYVCMKFRFNGSWWDLCEEHIAEHPGRHPPGAASIRLLLRHGWPAASASGPTRAMASQEQLPRVAGIFATNAISYPHTRV